MITHNGQYISGIYWKIDPGISILNTALSITKDVYWEFIQLRRAQDSGHKEKNREITHPMGYRITPKHP
jgi:hypothetical protein